MPPPLEPLLLLLLLVQMLSRLGMEPMVVAATGESGSPRVRIHVCQQPPVTLPSPYGESPKETIGVRETSRANELPKETIGRPAMKRTAKSSHTLPSPIPPGGVHEDIVGSTATGAYPAGAKPNNLRRTLIQYPVAWDPPRSPTYHHSDSPLPMPRPAPLGAHIPGSNRTEARSFPLDFYGRWDWINYS